MVPIVLTGCGGGSGGGAPTSGELTVSTDWTDFEQPLGGLSEQIELLDANGIVQASTVVNHTSVKSTAILGPLPSGNYHLNVQLFSAANLTGALKSQFDEALNLAGSENLTVDVGNAPTQLVVTPGTASVTQQQSVQFYVEGRDASGNRVCLPPNAVVWSQLGGVVSVSSTGIAIGSAVGAGSVQAKDAAANLLGAASVTVTPFAVASTKWTILVYMNASNDLDQFSVPNFLQMQQAATNPQVRIVVQWKQAVIPGYSPSPSFVGTRRYLVSSSSGKAVVSQLIEDLGPNVDMGSAQTLNDFIKWGETYFPSTRTCVVVWDHGNGWQPAAVSKTALARKVSPYGVSYDEQTGNHIDIWQLPAAFQASQKLDVVAWDSSLMQMLEVGYQIRNQASYMVGSEESPPGAGYPYQLVFAKFAANPDASTAALAQSFVDGMLQFYTVNGVNVNGVDNIEQSVVDLSQMGTVATQVSGLADALIANKASLGAIAPKVRSNAQSYPPGDAVRIYRDVYDVCTQLAAQGAPQAVVSAGVGVQSAISSAVVYEGHGNDNPNSHGLSIDFSSGPEFGPVANVYGEMSFAQDTDWPKWLTVAP